MTKRTLKRAGMMTDIHFGKKANSPQHNEDCLRYIDWFCEQVKENNCDYIAFLGDWNEHRSALNISTLNYSYQGAKKLNELNLPVYFIVGNHDLYHRNRRDVHSVVNFQEFTNFVVIDQPQIIEEVEGKMLLSPYMFTDEYPGLAKYLSLPFWAGHFEFKGFEVTGSGVIMPTGPEPTDFFGPRDIISGHFHKRQKQWNITYMGNAFPMDFGDAGDVNRGMMIYDHIQQERTFIDWPYCPKYIKTELSSILDGTVKLLPESRVQVLADIPISYEESTFIKKNFTDKYQLREFRLDESPDIQLIISETDGKNVLEGVDKLAGVDELVQLMLNEIESDHIDPIKLNEIYRNLKIDL